MKKREMIIVGVALLAAGYGLLDYFVLARESSVKSEVAFQEQQTELAAFIQGAQLQLTAISGKDNARIHHQIVRAEAQWTHDPFEQQAIADTDTPGQDSTRDAGVEMHYTGFIMAGNTLLAVINQMEYAIGDALLDIGYKIISISPEWVVLLTQDSSEIIIPLEEN